MGSGSSAECIIHVYTGDRKNAGTDANVQIKLHDERGMSTKNKKLDRFFKNDHERGHADKFFIKKLPAEFGNVERIEFWRDNAGAGSDWYVQKIVVEDCRSKHQHVFPVHRWIKADFHYVIRELDTSLPQDDIQLTQRSMEMTEVRQIYEYAQKVPGIPIQVGLIDLINASFYSSYNI